VAFEVARLGAQQKPAVPPPPSLKPFLKFQKLPDKALGPVRKAVEADEEFRQRVGLVATEELVGRAGLLWLQRPDGWQEELAAIVAEQEEAEAAAAADKAERSALRRLEAAEQAARSAAAEAAALRAEVHREREHRRAAEQERDRLSRRADQLDIELGGARRRLADADAQAASCEQRLGEAEQRSEAAEDRATRAEQALAAAESAASLAEGTAPGPDSTEEARRTSAPPPVEDDEREADRPATLTEALTDAAEATRRLSAALAAASAAAADLGVATSAAPAHDGDGVATEQRGPARAPRPRRVPLALPGGVWADSPEAALFLVRAPGVLLVVDGYNVAKLGWPELTLAEQRVRLLDALDELAARYGTDIHVVFDGADVAQLPLRRRYLRVEFSPAGVKADDVIVQLAEELPAERPVVVATNDGEVRTGTRAAGANVISSEQLLGAARR
jgi:hypothetical protein